MWHSSDRLLIKTTQYCVWELSCFLSVDIWHYSCLLPSSDSDCIQPLLLQRLYTYCSERRYRRRQRRGLHWKFPGKAVSDCMTTCPTGNNCLLFCLLILQNRYTVMWCQWNTTYHLESPTVTKDGSPAQFCLTIMSVPSIPRSLVSALRMTCVKREKK